MADSSGTLFQYFKQPSKKVAEPATDIIDVKLQQPKLKKCDDNNNLDTEVQPKRRRNVINTENSGKRRKLSLATLREKQATVSAILLSNNENRQNSSNNSKSDKLSSNKGIPSTSACNKKLVSAKELCQKQTKGSSNEPFKASHACRYADTRQISHKDTEINDINKVRRSLNTLELSELDDMDKIKHMHPQFEKAFIISESDGEEDMISEYTDLSNCKTEASVLKHSKSNIKSVNAASNHLHSESDKTESSDQDQIISHRRSSRIRKPVRRFVIMSDPETDEDAKPQQKRKTLRPPKSDTSDDNLIIIKEVKAPKKTISNVLSGRPPHNKPPRTSSTKLMQEAKRLMNTVNQDTAGSPRISHAQCVLSTSKRTERVIQATIWPTITHVNMSSEIVIYPAVELVLKNNVTECNAFDSSQVFRYKVEPHKVSTGNVDTKTYDECVDELQAIHPQRSIPDCIEYYRAVTRRSQISSDDILPLEVSKRVPEHRPWSQVYCPGDYKQHIGNPGPVKELYKWLDGWRTKLLNVKTRHGSYSSASDSDFAWSGDDEARWLDNVVLLCGPCGVGKSGVIATLAGQLGYKIMEVNASSERTGKHVAELFSEASQSHSLTGKSGSADFTKVLADITSRERTKKLAKKRGLDNFFGKRGDSSADSSCEVVDLEKLASTKKPMKTKTPKKPKKFKGKPSANQSKLSFSKGKHRKSSKLRESSTKVANIDVKVEKLSLIVLEEIDIAFEVDRGFYLAIVALTRVAKRPIVLTSNNPNVKLPSEADFLTLHFEPPPVEQISVRMVSLSLSWNNYILPYPLHQYIQYLSSDIRRTLADLEFLNIPAKTLTQLDLTGHLLGVEGLNSQQLILEQSQAQNIQYVYLNLKKCVKSRTTARSARRTLQEMIVSCDTFMFLDQLGQESCEEWIMDPVRYSSSLTETQKYPAQASCSNIELRAAVESQLLTFLGGELVGSTTGRINRFKFKEQKRWNKVTEVHRACSNSKTVSYLSLASSSVMDELSALRGICRMEKMREEGNLKRRFLHYLNKELEEKTRGQMSEYCLL